MKRDRGVSPIIATVLIILITIVAAGIIAPFVINFTKSNLRGSEECFEVLGKLSFAETVYNCNAEISGNAGTGFSVRVDDEKIIGFKATLFKGGDANTYEISPNSEDNDEEKIRMRGVNFNLNISIVDLEVPTKGGVRTYIANGSFDRVEIASILQGSRICDTADSIEIKTCTDPDAIANVTQTFS